ncbi:MAG: hypothetical protein ACO1TE_14205, partial [Prosthecobacter sp.]
QTIKGGHTFTPATSAGVLNWGTAPFKGWSADIEIDDFVVTVKPPQHPDFITNLRTGAACG